MARTALAIQEVSRTGLTPSYTAANAEGHSIANAGRMFLHVKNASGSAVTVTVLFGRTIDGQDLSATGRTVTVPATTGDKMIGPFPPGDYGGTVSVNFSAVTTVTCAAIVL